MKKTLLGLALAGFTIIAATHAAAAYPDKPIRMVVPASAGGAADTLARVVGKRLSDKLGQPVVIENKPGAAAIIGMTEIAKANPDGYTLGMTFAGAMTINPSLYESLSYDPAKDFAPVAIVAVSPLIIAASPELGAKSLQDLLDMAKAKPGTLTFASTGTGSTQHLSMELFKSTTGVDLLHIPYKGSSASVVDVQSGRVSVISDNAITLLPLIQSDKLVPLAVETAERIPAMPDLPTVAEQGFPGYEAVGWYGLVAPRGTPEPIVASLNEAVNDMLADPEFTKWLDGQGMQPKTETPAGFASYIAAETEKWASVIETAKVPKQASR